MPQKRAPKEIATRIKSELQKATSGRGLVTLALVVLGQVAFEHYVFHSVLHVNDWDLSIIAKAYQRMATLGFRSTEPTYTSIIEVTSWDRTSGICNKREYLNRILLKVLEQHPVAVVATYTLSPEEICSNQETDRLLKTVHDGCKSIPIVFGHDLGKNYEVAAHIDISGGKCATGYTNPEDDYRRLPLVIHGEPDAGQSLSWTAASLTKPELKDKPLIRDSLRDGSPLYSSVFSTLDFHDRTITDAELFSNRDSKPATITGRVVVIGGFDGDGILNTSAGPLQGHLVHASYIESFLDRRLFRVIPECGHILISMLFWLWVDFTSLLLLPIGWRGALLALCCLTIALAALLIAAVLLIQFFGYYNDFSTVSISGLAIWLITSIRAVFHGH